MATVTHLKDWLSRKSRPPSLPVEVGPFGFIVDGSFIAWQTVSEIWAYTPDTIATGETSLGFVAGGQCLSICERQPGFADLEVAMVAAFPVAADWRRQVVAPRSRVNRILLYRRG